MLYIFVYAYFNQSIKVKYKLFTYLNMVINIV